jgi:hypothetical protein
MAIEGQVREGRLGDGFEECLIRSNGVYLPKDNNELREIIESLRVFASTHGMTTLGELLADAGIVVEMEIVEQAATLDVSTADETRSH